MSHPSNAENIEIDEANESHMAWHNVRPLDVWQVMDGEPLWCANKNGMTADWQLVGRTYGGRAIVAHLIYDEDRASVRPITARDCTAAEVARWGI